MIKEILLEVDEIQRENSLEDQLYTHISNCILNNNESAFLQTTSHSIFVAIIQLKVDY